MNRNRSGNEFLGCGWSFPPTFDPHRGGVAMVSAEQDIMQSLQVLFTTVQGERVMLPDYGSGLAALVFDSIDASLQQRIRRLLCDAILFYEPRIEVGEGDIIVTPEPSESGLVLITLSYRIRQTNTRSNMVFPFYCAEGTNVRAIGPQ